jgi:uncharacterized DUF497 family protein
MRYVREVATIVAGDFEWDEDKADSNLRKHGVSFEEAATAFEDPNHALLEDGGSRYLLIGFSVRGRLLTVVHVERGERERIISAWRATETETRMYEKG